ncbi:hypothetical protein CMQ_5236 [Grosmannia clavigera kw1407]|uniref:Uncharacterized protein n=1 Tax=Grosmannia clavigera (strain kw1407 / UAMH 11150) TaxID=655863 RepID=F0XB33_GROCL|nr:uncharacterized protein CMQ_5236 [Grosmannia clavigera kw1407]EFX04974.1 hypothetical protein CMQ_5236 [Grosmannia clavigera kw1407]
MIDSPFPVLCWQPSSLSCRRSSGPSDTRLLRSYEQAFLLDPDPFELAMPATPSWTPQWPHGLTKNGSTCPCCQPGVMDRKSRARRLKDQAQLDAQYEHLRDLYPRRSPPLNRALSSPDRQKPSLFQPAQTRADAVPRNAEDGRDSEQDQHVERNADAADDEEDDTEDEHGDSSDGNMGKKGDDDERENDREKDRDKEEQDQQNAQDGDDEQEEDEDEEDDEDDDDEDEEEDDGDDEDEEGEDDTDVEGVVKKEPEEFRIRIDSANAAFMQQPPPQSGLPSCREEEDTIVVKLVPDSMDVDSDMFLDDDDEFVHFDSRQPTSLMAYGPMSSAAAAAMQQQQQQRQNLWPHSRPRHRPRPQQLAPQPRPIVVSSGLAEQNAHLRTQPPRLQPRPPAYPPHPSRPTQPPTLSRLRVDAPVLADPSDPGTAQTPAGMEAFWDVIISPPAYLVASADGTVVEARQLRREARSQAIEAARDRLRRLRSGESPLASRRGPLASRSSSLSSLSSLSSSNISNTANARTEASDQADLLGVEQGRSIRKRPCPCCNMYIRRDRSILPEEDYAREKIHGDYIPISILYDMLPRPPNPFADDE